MQNINPSPTENGSETTKEIRHLYDEGIVLFCASKYSEAIRCFDKILTINPNSKVAVGYKGLAFVKMNMRKKAIECYEHAFSRL